MRQYVLAKIVLLFSPPTISDPEDNGRFLFPPVVERVAQPFPVGPSPPFVRPGDSRSRDAMQDQSPLPYKDL